MAISLYAATIPSFLQILRSVSGLLDKAELHCSTNGTTPEELIQARLAEDMYPFAYQVKSTAVHSLGAIEGLRRGTFSPDRTEPPGSFTGLRERVSETIVALEALDPAEVDGLADRDMRFQAGSFSKDYTGQDFLLSFSQPNFYFHAATAFGILRMKGLAIGKLDYLGMLRTKA
jgi:uncharacterized protein